MSAIPEDVGLIPVPTQDQPLRDEDIVNLFYVVV